MSAFERYAEAAGASQKRPAPATITLDPEEFAATWSARPVAPIKFGLRLPSEREIMTARAEAAKVAVNLHGADEPEEREAAFGDALLAFGCARCLCDPLDLMAPHPVLPFADDMVRDALPSAALRRVWDAVERLAAEVSPLVAEATDEDLRGLAAAILTGRHHEIDGPAAATFRRFATYMLDSLPEE